MQNKEFLEEFKDALYDTMIAYMQGIVDKELKASNEDKWITIHPHGKGDDGDGEGKDYRRLLIKDGESVKDAMHRQGYYDKRKAKDEKREKEEKSKIYTEKNYQDFSKIYYDDNQNTWQFKKEKGGKFFYSRTDENGNWVTGNKSKTFEELADKLDENNTIKLVLPKTKVRGKEEFAEDKANIQKFLDKGFSIKAQYDDGYEIKYVLEKEKQTDPQKQNAEIEEILKEKSQLKNEYINLRNELIKAAEMFKKNKITYEEVSEKNIAAQNKRKEYEKAQEKSKNYIFRHSRPLPDNAKIAGMAKEKPMNFEEANKNKSNPNFVQDPENIKYNTNCQSCVVSYEARRRGYNVQATERNKLNKSQQLAENSSYSFFDTKNNKPCEFETIKSTNSVNLYNILDKTVKQNERYFFRYYWYDGKETGGHIVTMERDENNKLALYDPQTGTRKYKDEILYYFKSYLKYKDNKSETQILRVDDKPFNEYFVNNGVLVGY